MTQEELLKETKRCVVYFMDTPRIRTALGACQRKLEEKRDEWERTTKVACENPWEKTLKNFTESMQALRDIEAGRPMPPEILASAAKIKDIIGKRELEGVKDMPELRRELDRGSDKNASLVDMLNAASEQYILDDLRLALKKFRKDNLGSIEFGMDTAFKHKVIDTAEKQEFLNILVEPLNHLHTHADSTSFLEEVKLLGGVKRRPIFEMEEALDYLKTGLQTTKQNHHEINEALDDLNDVVENFSNDVAPYIQALKQLPRFKSVASPVRC